MRTLKYIVVLFSVTLWLVSCAEKAAEAPPDTFEIQKSVQDVPAGASEKSMLIAKSSKPESPPSAPSETVLHGPALISDTFDDSPVTETQRIDGYLSALKSAAYTFNPPSPIRVDEAVTIHLWLDPKSSPTVLAEELRKLVPQDASRVESGETKWSPRMRATLSGADTDFEIKPIDPEEQTVNTTERTRWSWIITPRRAGKELALHLRLIALLPPELGPPTTITSLDRKINVEVTVWWLFDHYFEKYWQWLLGGLGTIVMSIFAWWWKNRKGS